MRLFGAPLLATAVLGQKYGNDNGKGQGFGDPHFVVQAPGQDQLCFDFNPRGGNEMNILIDPESSLSITATATERGAGRSFMSSIHFASPGGAHLEFDIEGVHLAGLGDKKPTRKHPLTGHQQYGDIIFVERRDEDGIHEYTNIQMEDGPTFMIKGNAAKESLSVAIVDGTGIGQKSRGVIGKLIRENAYVVQETEQDMDGKAKAVVNIGLVNFKTFNMSIICRY